MLQRLSRKKENRERMLRNLAASIILHEKIITTKAKAKAVKSLLYNLLRLAQKNDLNSKRRALAILFSQKSVKRLFEDISARIENQPNSGVVRIINLQNRLGDNSMMAQVQLRLKTIEDVIKEEENEAKSSKAKKA